LMRDALIKALKHKPWVSRPMDAIQVLEVARERYLQESF